MSKHSPAVLVIARGLEWMKTNPRVEIAAYVGLLSAMEGDDQTAREMLAGCREFGKDHNGLIEMLEFMIAHRFEPPGAAAECARRLDTQDDVSPSVSVMIHTELLWHDMLARRFDEVKRRTNLMLSIGNAPAAAVAAAAMARYEGNEPRALRYDQESASLPPAERFYYQYLAAWATGLERQAHDCMARLIERDGALAEMARQTVIAAGGTVS